MIRWLDSLDKRSSSCLHELDSSALTIALYPFALFFNYKFFLLHIILISFVCRESIIYPLAYILTVIISVAMTLGLKQTLKRLRPIPNPLQNKPMTFRLMETNNSMPSGDSMQAAVFTYYILLPLGHLSIYVLLGEILFIVLIGLARVYYRCHYFGDVMVGAVLGALNAKVVHIITETIFFYIRL